MLKRLSIERFKSIRHLEIDCRKVNVFIGPPDTGKTNILDALQFLSRLGWQLPLNDALRLRSEIGYEALFFRQFFDAPFTIAVDEKRVEGRLAGGERALRLKDYPNGRDVTFGFGGTANWSDFAVFRFYAYTSASYWGYGTSSFDGTNIIATPDGGNLSYIARHRQPVYDFLKDLVADLGWKLRFDQNTKSFRMSDVRADDIIDYNLELLSDSIKRFFFFGSILLSTENATLIFDEPDVQAFPPYPKELGRMIADDATNQFFLTTHNPYLLGELAQKTPTEHLAIFLCGRDQDGGTTAKMLEQTEVAKVIEWGASVFFNLDELKT